MTLKQLQAEWLEESAYIKPEHGWSFYKQCADSLTPFILQQERDRELIRGFVSLVQTIVPPQYLCESTQELLQQARSRLKEME